MNDLSGAGNITAGGQTLTVNQPDPGLFSGVMSGAGGGLTMYGPNTLTLSGNNTYTGPTVVNVDAIFGTGTLALSGSGSIADSASLTVNAGATFDISQTTSGATVQALSGEGNINVGGQTLTVNLPNDPETFAGAIGGVGGGLTMNGPNHLTLSGPNNAYSGTTIINAGSLILSGIGSIFNSSLDVKTGATFDLGPTTINAYVNTLSGDAGSFILLSTVFPFTPGLTVTQLVPGTFAGVIKANGGEGGLTVNGPSTLTLSGTNTYTGPTVINADPLIDTGILALSGTGSIADSTSLTVNAGATFDLSLSTIDTSVQTLSGDTGSFILLSPLLNPQQLPLNLIVTQSGPEAFAGVIEANGGNGGLTINGPSALTLSGTNTYKGPTVINADPVAGMGTLALSGSGTIAPSTSLTINAGAALDLSLSTIDTSVQTLSGDADSFILLSPLLNPQQFPLNLIVTQSGPGTFDGVIEANGGNGGLTVNGPSTLTLSRNNNYKGPTVIHADPVAGTGRLALSGSGSIASSSSLTVSAGATFDISQTTNGATVNDLSGSGNITAGGQTLTVNLLDTETFSGVMSGAGGGLTLNGPSSLVLSGANTYTGATTVNAGTLIVSGDGSIAFSSLDVEAGAYCLFHVNASTSVYTLSGGGTLALPALGLTLRVHQADTKNPRKPADSTFAGTINGLGSLLINGRGTLTLSGNNSASYTGATGIGYRATLALSGSGSIAGPASSPAAPCGTGSTPLILGHFATFDLSKTTSDTYVNNLSSHSPLHAAIILSTFLNPDGSSPNLIVQQSIPAEFAGIISGPGGLIISGLTDQCTPGTLTLSGPSDYTGPTVINSPATLALTGYGAIHNSFSLTVAGPKAIFSISNTKFGGATIGALSGGGTVFIDKNMILTVNQNKIGNFTGNITGPGGLTVQGPSSLYLETPSSYTGPTVLYGTLALEGRGSIASSTSLYIEDVGSISIRHKYDSAESLGQWSYRRQPWHNPYGLSTRNYHFFGYLGERGKASTNRAWSTHYTIRSDRTGVD